MKPLFVTHRLALPEGVKPGAVIGKGGVHQKKIAATHRVRSYVDVNKREVILTGDFDRICRAIGDVEELFARLQAMSSWPRRKTFKKQKSKTQTWTRRVGAAETKALERSEVHHSALLNAETSGWRFIPQDVSPSSSSKRRYALHRAPVPPTVDVECPITDRRPWIRNLDGSFVLAMMAAVDAIEPPAESGPVKIKASLGLLEFGLRREQPTQTMSWQGLQQLRVPQELMPIWWNFCNRQSLSTRALLAQLRLLAAAAPTREVLTIYLRDGRTMGDFTIKYHRVNGHWVRQVGPAYRTRYYAYDLLLDPTTSCRLRVCSRVPATALALADVERFVEIRTPLGGSVFDARIGLRPTAPTWLRVLETTTKRKAHVTYAGLRFTLADHTRDGQRVRLVCRLDPRPPGANPVALGTGLGALVGRLLRLLGFVVEM